MTEVYRQGDIILEKVTKIPKDVEFAGLELDMKGETGNSHLLPGKVYTKVGSPVQEWIEVGKGGALMVHPEHPILTVPEGMYMVRRVRSYDPEKERKERAAWD